MNDRPSRSPGLERVRVTEAAAHSVYHFMGSVQTVLLFAGLREQCGKSSTGIISIS